MQHSEVDSILSQIRPTTAEGADLVLDLRDLLLSQGHPGKCVKCFFGLLGQLDRPGVLLPLRHWLESHVEISVTADGEPLETLPVKLNKRETVVEFCEREMRELYEDRAYQAKRIEMRFRYRQSAAA